VETISFVTGIRREHVYDRLNKLIKYNQVKPSTKKQTTFWKIVDDR